MEISSINNEDVKWQRGGKIPIDFPDTWGVRKSAFSKKGRLVEDTKAYQRLKLVKRSDLDDMEQMWYDQFDPQLFS